MIYKTREYGSSKATPPRLLVVSFVVSLLSHSLFSWRFYLYPEQDIIRGTPALEQQQHVVFLVVLQWIATLLAALSLVLGFHVDLARYSGVCSGFVAAILFLSWLELSSLSYAYTIGEHLVRGGKYLFLLLVPESWRRVSSDRITSTSTSSDRIISPPPPTTSSNTTAQPSGGAAGEADAHAYNHLNNNRWNSEDSQSNHDFQPWMNTISSWYLIAATCDGFSAYAGTLLYRTHRNFVLRAFIKEHTSPSPDEYGAATSTGRL
ncbi:unnamed protein product [Amoebophrya sp. A25]|nr:unnamed protein product [Amoebophrya sp. A25]|eukprot:GSA25T00019836001.1